MKFEIKTVISIITLTIAMAGFYYTTQMRLDNLEIKTKNLSKQIKNLKKTKSSR